MTNSSSIESRVYANALPKIFAVAVIVLLILGWYYHNRDTSAELEGKYSTQFNT